MLILGHSETNCYSRCFWSRHRVDPKWSGPWISNSSSTMHTQIVRQKLWKTNVHKRFGPKPSEVGLIASFNLVVNPWLLGFWVVKVGSPVTHQQLPRTDVHMVVKQSKFHNRWNIYAQGLSTTCRVSDAWVSGTPMNEVCFKKKSGGFLTGEINLVFKQHFGTERNCQSPRLANDNLKANRLVVSYPIIKVCPANLYHLSLGHLMKRCFCL